MEIEAEDSIDGEFGLDVETNVFSPTNFDTEFNVNVEEKKTKKAKKRRASLKKSTTPRSNEYSTNPRRNSCSSIFQAETVAVPDDVDINITSQEYLGDRLGLELFEDEVNSSPALTISHCPDSWKKTKSPRRRDSRSSVKEENLNEDIDFGFSDIDIPSGLDVNIDSMFSAPEWQDETSTEGCGYVEENPVLKECWKDPEVVSLPKIQDIPAMSKQNYDVWSRQSEPKRSGRRNVYLPPLSNKKYVSTKHQSKFGNSS